MQAHLFWGGTLERSGCRQVGVGKVTSGFTLGSGCRGGLLITPGRGQREREAILVQNTQIRQSKQGLPIISGRPSKPITHQDSGCSGNPPGLQLVTWSSHLPLHPPAHSPWTSKAGPAVFKERLQMWRDMSGREGRGRSWKALSGTKN